ncbi:MarR family winged helix-turn-helix transcriptional regulator [Streptomyces sp. NPDC055060]
MEGLRGYGERYKELGRRFSLWLGLHSTDAEALLEIVAAEERGTPLSPARLSERIQLSSGATTALLNRLEGADHIVRTREHTDRRVVTLHSRPHIRERADEFFAPLAVRMDARMATYPPELLARFEELLADLRKAMDEDLAERD